MKNILTLAHEDSGQEARLQAAIDIVQALDGHLICVGIGPAPIRLIDAFSEEALITAAEEAPIDENANQNSLHDRLRREGVSFEWIEAQGDIAPALNKHTCLADLIVLNRRLHTGSPRMDVIVGDILVASRKPVLAMPEETKSLRLHGADAMIAWDGSEEAARALSASVPLLRLAGNVVLVEIGDGSTCTPAEDAATYIGRYGIKPMIRRLDGRDDYVPLLLLREARHLRADYMVMGGFGDWRLAEHLFRGNSHWLLEASHVPLFMAH